MRQICDVCKTKPPKNYLCEIIDGQQTTRDLCDDCLRQHRAISGYDFPILDGTQRCYYCAAPAQSAGMNLEWEERARGERFHFACFRCASLYREFITVALAALPKGLSPNAQIDALTSLVTESDKQVSKRVGGGEA